jgi:proton glutamate symport protein
LKKISLTAWIFIGMVAGIALGAFVPNLATQLAPVSNVFLRLIRSIIAPLLFGTLVYGMAGGGDLKRMGRIGLKAILYFEAVTTIALFLGLAAVNLFRRPNPLCRLCKRRWPRCSNTSFRPASSMPWRAATCYRS